MNYYGNYSGISKRHDLFMWLFDRYNIPLLDNYFKHFIILNALSCVKNNALVE